MLTKIKVALIKLWITRLPKQKSHRYTSELPVIPFQQVIRTIISANKWVCQESFVQPQSGYQQNALRDHIKKRMPRAGESRILPKNKLSEITQKVANMIGITLLVYGSPALNPVTTDLWAYEEKMLTVTSLVGKPLNHALLFIWRANGYRNQSLIVQPWITG